MGWRGDKERGKRTARAYRLRVEVDCPLEPGALCKVWVSRTADAFDWTSPTFCRDPWLAWSDRQGEAFETVLDVDGWGVGEIPLPPPWTAARKASDSQPVTGDNDDNGDDNDDDNDNDDVNNVNDDNNCDNDNDNNNDDDCDNDNDPVAYVAYCVFDPEGNLRRIAVPTRVKPSDLEDDEP